jgi:hypothetical protein
MREGSYNGLIPEKVIEEAMARLHGTKVTTTSSTPIPTTLQTTLQTTTSTTSTTKSPTVTSSTTASTKAPTIITAKPQTTKHLNDSVEASPKKVLQPTNADPNTPFRRPTIPPLTVAVNEPRCQESLFYYNSELKGGMNAGLFIDLGHVHVTTACLKRCCEIESCDLVFLARDHCYAVDCFNADLCEPVQALHVNQDGPSVYYVRRDGKSILEKSECSTQLIH